MTPQSKAFKVVFLGQTTVGKTCLVCKLIKKTFPSHSKSTVGADFSVASFQLDSGQTVKIQLWDTAGQERFHSLAPLYYREAKGAFVVYDISARDTFDRAKLWVSEIRDRAPSCVIAFIGNKKDLRPFSEPSTPPPSPSSTPTFPPQNPSTYVSENEAKKYCKKENILFFEVSALEEQDLSYIVVALCNEIVDQAHKPLNHDSNQQEQKFEESTESVTITQQSARQDRRKSEVEEFNPRPSWGEERTNCCST